MMRTDDPTREYITWLCWISMVLPVYRDDFCRFAAFLFEEADASKDEATIVCEADEADQLESCAGNLWLERRFCYGRWYRVRHTWPSIDVQKTHQYQCCLNAALAVSTPEHVPLRAHRQEPSNVFTPSNPSRPSRSSHSLHT